MYRIMSCQSFCRRKYEYIVELLYGSDVGGTRLSRQRVERQLSPGI
jgi:hypothetical protein